MKQSGAAVTTPEASADAELVDAYAAGAWMPTLVVDGPEGLYVPQFAEDEDPEALQGKVEIFLEILGSDH
jgi:hypothetical protein